MDKTSVINVKQAPQFWRNDDQFVYIGRPSIFGNPYVVGQVCGLCGLTHRNGGSTLDCFTDYFQYSLCTNSEFAKAVKALAGKTLVCFCKPDPCHGDVIARYVNNL